jgi:hypothetical protein
MWLARWELALWFMVDEICETVMNILLLPARLIVIHLKSESRSQDGPGLIKAKGESMMRRLYKERHQSMRVRHGLG